MLSEPYLLSKLQAQSIQVMLMSNGHGLPSFPGLVWELCLLFGYMTEQVLCCSAKSCLCFSAIEKRGHLELFIGHTEGKCLQPIRLINCVLVHGLLPFDP